MLKKVGDRFEGVVGSGSGVGKQMEEGFDGRLVGGVKQEMFAEGS